MNSFIGIGRLTKDPDLRYTKDNLAVCTFTIAINRPKFNDNQQNEVDYINVLAWRKQAENVKKYVFKGSMVCVEGRVQTRSYDDKSGKKVFVTEIVANNVQFLDTKTQPKEDMPQEIYNEQKRADDQVYQDFGNSIELTDDDMNLNSEIAF